MPQRTFYDTLAKVRGRLRDALSPPKEDDDDFLRRLDEELAAKAVSRAEAPEPPPDKSAPSPRESREDRIAGVIGGIDDLVAEPEDTEKREHNEPVERFRRDPEARPRTISMREALDWQAKLDPPAPRRELPRDPAGYMPLRPSKRPHPSNR